MNFSDNLSIFLPPQSPKAQGPTCTSFKKKSEKISQRFSSRPACLKGRDVRHKVPLLSLAAVNKNGRSTYRPRRPFDFGEVFLSSPKRNPLDGTIVLFWNRQRGRINLLPISADLPLLEINFQWNFSGYLFASWESMCTFPVKNFSHSDISAPKF